MPRKKKHTAGPAPVRDTDRLMDKAFAHLEDGEPQKALAVGRRLEKTRPAAGLEIQALALRDMGRAEAAIRVLEKGAGQAAGAWRLWHLLGNLLSDEGRFDAALRAYDRALDLPGADAPALRFNRAMAFWRAGRHEAAEAVVGGLLADPAAAGLETDLRLNILAARIGILCDLGRASEALSLFDGVSPAADWADHPAALAQLEAKHAQALWASGRQADADAALARAIRLDKTNQSAQWLWREMRRDDDAPSATVFDLTVRGPWDAEAFPDADPADGFVTDYRIVAADPDEALRVVREFEPSEIRDALTIETSEAQGPCDEPKGVYWTSSYYFYSED